MEGGGGGESKKKKLQNVKNSVQLFMPFQTPIKL